MRRITGCCAAGSLRADRLIPFDDLDQALGAVIGIDRRRLQLAQAVARVASGSGLLPVAAAP